jgi:hypothetical protein
MPQKRPRSYRTPTWDAYMARIRRDEPLSFQGEPGPGRRTRDGDARVLGESWSSGTFGRSSRCLSPEDVRSAVDRPRRGGCHREQAYGVRLQQGEGVLPHTRGGGRARDLDLRNPRLRYELLADVVLGRTEDGVPVRCEARLGARRGGGCVELGVEQTVQIEVQCAEGQWSSRASVSTSPRGPRSWRMPRCFRCSRPYTTNRMTCRGVYSPNCGEVKFSEVRRLTSEGGIMLVVEGLRTRLENPGGSAKRGGDG